MSNLKHMSFSSEQLISKVLEMKTGAENKIQELENIKKQVQGIIDSQTEFLKNINQNIEIYITIVHELDELLDAPVKAIKNKNPILTTQLDNLNRTLPIH